MLGTENLPNKGKSREVLVKCVGVSREISGVSKGFKMALVQFQEFKKNFWVSTGYMRFQEGFRVFQGSFRRRCQGVIQRV